MLKTCLLLGAISAVLTARAEAAAIVTCAQPGFSETVSNGACAVGTGAGGTLQFSGITGSSITGNIFTVQALAEVIGTPATNSGPYPMTASATWDDIFALPTSNAGDIFKITVTGSGLGHPGSIDAGPLTYGGAEFCDARYVGNAACTETATVSAATLSSVELKGSDSITIDGACGLSNCGLSVNTELYEVVTVERFLSDGVTADPFTVTPEPSSLALLLLGVPAGFVFWRRR
jgi:hypothetical protein